MPPTKQQAYNKIAQLVERFNEHIDEYKRGNYNEHQTRVDYINPFFKALGWDVDNEQGFAEAYREVIHEDKVKVGGSTKAPDYGFTLYGQRKFFVDAKKPSINIKGDLAPAYQVRRYGWSAKVPISIVTDFEEFSIYDCTKKPKPTDKTSVSRIKYITYDKYLDEFDFLWEVFAKENLPKGRFDKYVQSDTRKKGTATVDDEFLKSIEEWRKYLATTIALRNKSLDEDEINYAVQKTIDRIIFLHMCEDRGVEQYGELKKVIEKGDIYKNLFSLFRTADDKYNSGLFDFKEDKITPGLVIDNKVLKAIIKELYYPDCEYEFSVMPADILGSVYERFLGKTIRLTKAHYAKIEEKPEVRKAGGVYYTPKYIVDYIVENTVGKLAPLNPPKRGKKITPSDVAKLRICDPACGSGSFLIGAYQYLLNWHLKYYTNLLNETKQPPHKGGRLPKAIRGILTPDGNLTTAEKKRILLNNIYGVDIDAQAVEVTKLNLLLKALEGETQASINQQMQLFHERVLPNLGNNIKCGNSLIGPDFYDTQLELFPEQIKKINAFDWKEGFPEIFEKGGFDAVIGNPPWVKQALIRDHKDYFKKHYRTYQGSADLYQYFIEKGLSILNKKGYFSFIVASKWLRAQYGLPLRQMLKEQTLHQLIDFGDLRVFRTATTYSSIIIASKFTKPNIKVPVLEVETLEFESLRRYVKDNNCMISKELLDDFGWTLKDEVEINLIKKLNENNIPLKKYVKNKLYRGLLTGYNEAFVVDESTKNEIIKDTRNEERLKPFLVGRDIKRYLKPRSNKFLIFFPKGFTNNSKGKNGVKWLDKNYSKIADHLIKYKQRAELRWDKGDYWWELRACDYYSEFEKPKIFWPGISKEVVSFTFDENNYYGNDNTHFIISNDKFLLGLLNSKISKYFLTNICDKVQGGFYRLKIIYVRQIPIPPKRNPEIEKLVNNILNLNKQLESTNLETQRQQIQRAIAHAEKRIDEMVYELYGLSEEEIRIVEGEG